MVDVCDKYLISYSNKFLSHPAMILFETLFIGSRHTRRQVFVSDTILPVGEELHKQPMNKVQGSETIRHARQGQRQLVGVGGGHGDRIKSWWEQEVGW